MARKPRVRPGSKRWCERRGVEFVAPRPICECGIVSPDAEFSCAVGRCPWPDRFPWPVAPAPAVQDGVEGLPVEALVE